MHMLADTVELARRVDTHKDTHTAVVVQAVSGAVVEQVTVAATPVGYQQLLRLADRQDGRRVWAIEGTGGYGAGLTRFLHATTSRWWSWTGPSGPLAATAPSPTPWMPPGRPAKRWVVTSWPSPEPPDHGLRCRCGWLPAAARSRPLATPNANFTRW